MPEIRDRVLELRRVPARDLVQNPANWRRHGEAQQRALSSILQRVGYVGALVARETPEGLELIDGHLRAGTTPDAIVPVLVVDLDDEDASLVLATLDPLGEMAEVDPAALAELLDSVSLSQDDLQEFLFSHLDPEQLAAQATGFLDAVAEGGEAPWQAPAPEHGYFTISVTVTEAQRDVIRGALVRAKEGGATTTQEALVTICETYMEGATDAGSGGAAAADSGVG